MAKVCTVPISYLQLSQQNCEGQKNLMYLCQLKTGHDVGILCRSARIQTHLGPAFEQGNACRALWVRVFTSALVFVVTSALWAAACSTGGVSHFKTTWNLTRVSAGFCSWDRETLVVWTDWGISRAREGGDCPTLLCAVVPSSPLCSFGHHNIKKHTELLESAQRRASKMVKGWKGNLMRSGLNEPG